MSQGNPTKVEINKYSENWVLYGDQSKAWRVAYPKSKASAEVVHNKASLMHKMDDVQVRIAELQNIRREVADETCGLNAAWVAKRLKDMSELDVLDIMEKDLRSFKPLDKWPKIWRTSISGIDLVMISNEDDNIDAIVKKIKWLYV